MTEKALLEGVGETVRWTAEVGRRTGARTFRIGATQGVRELNDGDACDPGQPIEWHVTLCYADADVTGRSVCPPGHSPNRHIQEACVDLMRKLGATVTTTELPA